jgi:hypothetical protein
MSLRGLWVYKRAVDMNTTPSLTGGNPGRTAINILRPFNVYDQVFQRRDPGPDGALNTADDGDMVTLYDYNPAYRGAAFVGNMNLNADKDRQDRYNSFEVLLTKRQTGRWFANTSFLATKNHRYLITVVQSPNDLVNSLDETWDWNYKLAGGYSFPWGINASVLEAAYSGFSRQRRAVFRAADPAGGRAFPSSSTITQRMEKYGASRMPIRNTMNIRVDKEFSLGGNKRFTASVDAFNALNSNAAWAEQQATVNEQSGPTYGYVTRIVTPRVIRFGAAYRF